MKKDRVEVTLDIKTVRALLYTLNQALDKDRTTVFERERAKVLNEFSNYLTYATRMQTGEEL